LLPVDQPGSIVIQSYGEERVNQQRAKIMEKARAKRRRRQERKSKASAAPNEGMGLADKVIELAQGAAGQVGDLVKTIATNIGGAVS
jgi:hypothetical protein